MAARQGKSRQHRTLKTALTDEELAAFKEAIHPVSQVDAIRSLVLWFTSQDDVIRKEILGILPHALRPDIARIMLRRMGKK